MAKKIIVTGGSGLLGRAISANLSSAKDQSYQVQRWVFNRVRDEKMDKRVNIAIKDEVEAAVNEFKPDAIVHCAALRAPDIVNQQRELSNSVNVFGAQYVAEAAARQGAKLIYISTDYVFDGNNPPYSENAEPNPINEYGRQKLDGEKMAFKHCPDAIVLRVPVLYGPVEYLGEGAVDVIMQNILNREKPGEMSHYERRYPTHVDDVAAVVRLLLDHALQDEKSGQKAVSKIRGVYHWSGDEEMTKHDMACAMSEVFSLPIDHLSPNASAPPAGTATQRPYNAKLGCQRLLDLGARNRFNFKNGIKMALEKHVNPN